MTDVGKTWRTRERAWEPRASPSNSKPESAAMNPIAIRRIATDEQVVAAAELEAAGYPPDEAASLSTLRFRFANAPDLFLGAFDGDTLIGFIVATRTHSERLTEESMKAHEPFGETVAVHSVCVDHVHRRKGIALSLLNAFKEHCAELNGSKDAGIKRIALIAKENLVNLYQKAGFTLLGLSEVVHGKDPWFELRFDL